jgi:hypothetical protein
MAAQLIECTSLNEQSTCPDGPGQEQSASIPRTAMRTCGGDRKDP